MKSHGVKESQGYRVHAIRHIRLPLPSANPSDWAISHPFHGISNNSFVMWSATDDVKKSSFRIQF